jgi:1,4-alpha-glucan branching enzyme
MKKAAVANSKKFSVTFELPAEIEAESLAVVGDFNNWDANATPMQKRKGGWTKTVRLDPGMYRFRYLADGKQWHNDPTADAFEPSGFGEDNCVLHVG